MKTKIRFVTAFLFIVAAATGQSVVKIEGTVSNASGGIVYLQEFRDKIFYTVDSAWVKDGHFRFSSSISIPEVYGLTLNKEKSPVFLFLDAEDTSVKVELDSASYYRNTKITGSKASDLYEKYKAAGRDFKIDAFIRENPNSIVSTYLLYRNFAYRLEPEQIREYLALLNPSLQESVYGKNLQGYLVTLEKVKIGEKAPDFTLADTEDKPVKLSDHFGKYILLDFWAAWCGPCRKENPNVVDAYQKYKDKGFDVFGVSLDRTKDAWLKAIEKDNLTWTHVSDLIYWKSAPAALYGVRAIPANFLINPEGIIIAKNLRGEDLQNKLAEIFGGGVASTAAGDE